MASAFRLCLFSRREHQIESTCVEGELVSRCGNREGITLVGLSGGRWDVGNALMGTGMILTLLLEVVYCL